MKTTVDKRPRIQKKNDQFDISKNNIINFISWYVFICFFRQKLFYQHQRTQEYTNPDNINYIINIKNIAINHKPKITKMNQVLSL